MLASKPYVIGVTGGIGCGKTEAALINAVEPGTELLGVYTRDGEALSLDLPGDGILPGIDSQGPCEGDEENVPGTGVGNPGLPHPCR